MKSALTSPKLLIFNAMFFVCGLTISPQGNASDLAAYDAIAAAPDHHRVVFENEKVRVLDVTIKPGEKEPFHVHPPSVMTVITGAKLRITEATLNDGKLVTGKTQGRQRQFSATSVMESARAAVSGEYRFGHVSCVSD